MYRQVQLQRHALRQYPILHGGDGRRPGGTSSRRDALPSPCRAGFKGFEGGGFKGFEGGGFEGLAGGGFIQGLRGRRLRGSRDSRRSGVSTTCRMVSEMPPPAAAAAPGRGRSAAVLSFSGAPLHACHPLNVGSLRLARLAMQRARSGDAGGLRRDIAAAAHTQKSSGSPGPPCFRA